MLQREGTSRSFSGRGPRGAPGMKRRVHPLQRTGTSRFCNGHGPRAAPGTNGRAQWLHGRGVSPSCSRRGRRGAPGTSGRARRLQHWCRNNIPGGPTGTVQDETRNGPPCFDAATTNNNAANDSRCENPEKSTKTSKFNVQSERKWNSTSRSENLRLLQSCSQKKKQDSHSRCGKNTAFTNKRVSGFQGFRVLGF